MTEETPSEEGVFGRLVTIEWPEPGVAAFANNLLAVSDGGTTYLTFCQIAPPILMGTEEERREQLQSLGSLKAQAVARIVVPVDTLAKMIGVLQKQIDRVGKKGSDDSTSDT